MIKLILAFSFLVFLTFSRIYNNQFTIGEIRRGKGWTFLDRMSFDEGTAFIKFSIKIQSETDPKNDPLLIQLAMIPDFLWAQQQLFKCEKKSSLDGTVSQLIELRKSGGYEGVYLQQIKLEKPTTYHFVLKDCEKLIANQYFRKETRIIINLDMKNGQYEHGSDEHINKYMLPLLLILTVIMTYFTKGPQHNQVGEQKDWAKFILLITLAINFFALIFYYIGFLIYLNGGQFYGFFDFVYLFFHSLSQSMLTSLIIFIAYGWTITFTKDAQFDLYIPLVAMLGIINLILTLLGKINDGDFDKYHMYDTIPSYLLVFFRVCTVIIFIIGIIKLYFQTSKNSDMIKFLANFGFIGAIYFLSLPAIMLLVSFLPASQRKQIVFFSVECIKNAVNISLTWMISSKKSRYKQLRHTGQSFFQQGNKIL